MYAGQDLKFRQEDLSYKIRKPFFYAYNIVPAVIIFVAGELTGFRMFGTGSSNIRGVFSASKQALQQPKRSLYHRSYTELKKKALPSSARAK